MSAFLQYTGPDGEAWRVELGEALLKDFGLSPAELVDWHRALSATEMADVWEVVGRFYGVFRVLGGFDPGRSVPASAEAIGKALGRKTAAIADLLTQAREWWKRAVAARPARDEHPTSNIQHPTSNVGAAEVDGVLAEYGFGGVKAERERTFLYQRLGELKKYLQQDGLRSAVLSMLRNELNLLGMDTAIALNRLHIDSLAEKGEDSKDHGSIGAASRELRELMNDRARLQKAIEDTMEHLGIWQTPGEMRKRESFSRSIAGVVEGIQAYYSDGSRELIDGVHTEGEVEVLLKAYDQRAPQYRPDLSVLVVPAAVAGLWDPNYTPPAAPRLAHRWLARGLRIGVGEARQEDGVEVAELDRDPEE